MLEKELVEKAKKIKLLILDVDGVLTDGKIIYDSKGRDLKNFCVHDGLGVWLLKKAGIPTVILTAKSSKTIKLRAQDMQIEEIFEDVERKGGILDRILRKYKVNTEEICFVGDDLVDLSIMKRIGLPIAVKNACKEIKDISFYITEAEGGKGAVREVCEIILKAKGKWEELVSVHF
jgi:3-deoxy-D-manno-octulosonate 8-phosphate phosphatase (KDO 8-P phosphatase)